LLHNAGFGGANMLSKNVQYDEKASNLLSFLTRVAEVKDQRGAIFALIAILSH
jgi:hypothetical protein